MSLARIKVWNPGDVLTAADLNAEFNNLLNNTNGLISPFTANVSAGGFQITNLVVEKLGLGPTAGTAGRFFYNTGQNLLGFDNGTQIRLLDNIRRITVLSSSQTWSRSTDVSKAWVQVLGGGGGGGASSTTAAGNTSAAGGGGAGALCTALITLTSSMTGATITCNTTAGAAGGAAPGGTGATGGTTIWADGTNTLTANGGVGGAGVPQTVGTGTNPGAGGGAASGGSINMTGETGYPGIVINGLGQVPGGGADSMFGAGGRTAGSGTGTAATGFGAAGQGGGSGPSAAANAGGAGAPGAVIIYELG